MKTNKLKALEDLLLELQNELKDLNHSIHHSNASKQLKLKWEFKTAMYEGGIIATRKAIEQTKIENEENKFDFPT